MTALSYSGSPQKPRVRTPLGLMSITPPNGTGLQMNLCLNAVLTEQPARPPAPSLRRMQQTHVFRHYCSL